MSASQWAEHWPGTHRALGSIHPQYQVNTSGVHMPTVPGGLKVQSHPQLHTEFKASLGYLRLSMEKKPNSHSSPWSAEKQD